MSPEQQQQANAADSDGDSAQQEEKEVDQAKAEHATSKLGPSSLRHHEDGSVTIEGEQVDDPRGVQGRADPRRPERP
jgi:hypothetical protein